jgi:GAF domain-containing protein
LVPDVHAFEGHVACSSLTASELVLPVVVNGQVVAVLDIDSVTPGDFISADVEGMNALMDLLSNQWLVWE